MKTTVVKFKLLSPEAKAPFRAHTADAGWDFTATWRKRIGLFKWQYGTGVALEIPDGYEGQARMRSSVHKTGMILSNGTGTIDAPFRGEVTAVFWKIPFIGKKYEVGDRIFQLIISEIPKVAFMQVSNLSKTDRGIGGYGSTGGFGKQKDKQNNNKKTNGGK